MDPTEPTVDPARRECSFAGLRYTADPCPDASRGDLFKSAAVGGGLGWGVSFLLGASPLGRLVGVTAGALLGTYASRHHVYVDWDPDRQRYGSGRGDGPSPDAPLPPSPTQGVF